MSRLSRWHTRPRPPSPQAAWRFAVSLTTVAVTGAGLQAAPADAQPAPVPACATGPAPPAADAGIHAVFDGLLRAFVHDGRVAYACFQAHEDQLDRYLATLDATDPTTLPAGEALALWINAYNAFTIKLILTRYPRITSIKDIPFRWKRRDWRVGGRRVSLDAIEHQILRREFREPRIHFAIVCASTSCPSLAPEAYVAPRLEAQLDRAARAFLADTARGFRRGPAGRPRAPDYLSSIFKWFGEDFERNGGTVLEFVERYLPPAERAALADGPEPSVRYLDYDWRLNDVPAAALGSGEAYSP